MPPALVDALKRQFTPGGPNAMPQPVGAPASGMPMPQPVATPPSGVPLNSRPGPTLPQAQMPGPLPMSTPPNGMAAPPSAAVPKVTDDPGVVKGSNGPSPTMMGEMPKTPDLGSYLNPALTQYRNDLSGYQKADEANRIDPNNVKPRLWERLLGFGLGITQLKNPENAANVAGEVVNRRRTGAEQARNTALAPWTQRLQQDKEGIPLAESAARTGYQQGQLDLDAAKENRERFTAITNSEYKDALTAIKDEVAKGNIEKAQNQLDQQQKVLEEKTERDKDWYQMQHAMLDIRQQLADARDRQVDKSDKPKPAQISATENAKSQAIAKAHQAYTKATQGLPTDPKAQWTEEQLGQLQAAKDAYNQAAQDAEDAYENKVTEMGGTAPHQDVTSSPEWTGKGSPGAPTSSGSAPAAKPAAASDNGVPTTMGPKGETPVKTASQGATKIGYYKSTGQWMLVPQNNSGGK